VSRLIDGLRNGEPAALDGLFATLYEELRLLAHRQRLHWRGDQTLDTTALLHEAYLKLAGQRRVRVASRTHFLALASKAMRHIFCNYAEERRAWKRGGRLERVSLGRIEQSATDDIHARELAEEDVIAALEAALRKLEQLQPRAVDVVECRFYGGMTVEETAEALGISPRTVKRHWAFAQAWLNRELQQVA
jgi:RNA polymerase sigma factor (TIGR02999 family)